MNRRILFAAWILALAAASPAAAQIANVTVAIDGLACPFCVYGIEKKLEAVDSVTDVSIDLKTGLATVGLAEGASPDVKTLRRAVEKAGFTPRSIRLTATGTLSIEESTIVLQVRGTETRFILFEAGHEDGPPFFAPERLPELTAWAEDATPVAVTGSVHEHPDGPPGLSADKVEAVQRLRFNVEGMRCEQCVARLTSLLEATPGVSHAAVDLASKRVELEGVGVPLDAAALRAVIDEAGFRASLPKEPADR